MATVAAAQADSFVDMVGVNVHSSFTDQSYGQNWVPLLTNLGVRHVRDNLAFTGSGGTACASAATAMAAAEVDVLYIVDGAATLSSLLASSLPAPGAVEPYNEWDSNGGASWATTLQTFQPTLYSQIKAKWPNCVVLGPSLGLNSNGPSLGSLTPNLDFVNIHAYGHPASIPEYSSTYLQYAVSSSDTNSTAPALPHWLTENGLSNGSPADDNSITRTSYTTPLAAGRLYPRLAMSAYQLGAKRWYIYNLLDARTTPIRQGEDRYGLYDASLTAKPAGVSMRSLLHLLADPGSTFSPASLGITTNGPNNTYLNTQLFQKRDGSFWLAFWHAYKATASPDGGGTGYWSGADQPEVNIPVTFQFDRTFRTTALYRPLNGTSAVSQTGAAAGLTVTSQLDVQLLKLSGVVKPGIPVRGMRAYYDTRTASNG